VIRERTAEDLDECVRVLSEVHRVDGYPSVWPSDPKRWIGAIDSGAWVDADGSRITGHLAVRIGTSVTWPMAAARSVWVARFFVGPEHRNKGVGQALLERAVTFAHALSLDAMLEVATSGADAIALYESSGWDRAAERVAEWTDASGRHPTVFLYSRTAQ
jgi:GNAT superfamily N-acetyltransferase